MKGHDLQPALKWAQEHRKELSATAQGCGLEFSLHRLHFLQVLKADGEPCHLWAGTQQCISLALLLIDQLPACQLPVRCLSCLARRLSRLGNMVILRHGLSAPPARLQGL